MENIKRKNCKQNVPFSSHVVTVILLMALVAGYSIGMVADEGRKIMGMSAEIGWVVFLTSLTILVHRSVESCKKIAQECAKYRKNLHPSV